MPKYVKIQCRQWLDIVEGKTDGAYVDKSAYNRLAAVLKLIQHPDLHCPMDEGLEDYAWLFITAIFCTKNQDGGRYYTTGLLEIGRKNYKTFLCAVIFILLMLTEPRFSRFFSVAPDFALSNELKVAIQKIIKSSPLLIDPVKPAFKILRVQVKCLLTDSEYNPLAYSRDRMDGRMAHAFLADEAGAMDAYPVEAMRSSQLSLPDGLGIVISTQYPNDNNVMLDEIDISKKTLDGILEEKRRFSLLYEPDLELRTGDNWKTDDKVIYQANPVAVTNKQMFSRLKGARTMAIEYENKRENFLCKHCNILYKGLGVEGYIDVQTVKKCVWEKNPGWWKGKRVWLGVDLSMSDDNTACAMVTTEGGYVYAKVIGFAPSGRLDSKSTKEKVDYKKLVKDGDCLPCGDEVIDYAAVKNEIKKLEDTYGVEIVQIGYDRWNALATIQALEADGYECVEIKQHSSVLHPATKWLRELILEGLFRYEPNRLLEINFENARCTEDTNLNKYVNKKRSSGKVDMVVALINAMYLLQQEELYDLDFVAQIL